MPFDLMNQTKFGEFSVRYAITGILHRLKRLVALAVLVMCDTPIAVYGRIILAGTGVVRNSPTHDTIVRAYCIRPNDTTRHDTTRHDTTRHDTTRHDTTRHDNYINNSKKSTQKNKNFKFFENARRGVWHTPATNNKNFLFLGFINEAIRMCEKSFAHTYGFFCALSRVPILAKFNF